MSSNTITPPLASQANEIMCSPREERKKRTLEEENDAVKRPKTAIAEGGANDDNNEEIMDICFDSDTVEGQFQTFHACLSAFKEGMERTFRLERAKHKEELEAEKKKTAEAKAELAKALEQQQAATKQAEEAETHAKSAQKDLVKLQDMTKKIQGELADAVNKLAGWTKQSHPSPIQEHDEAATPSTSSGAAAASAATRAVAAVSSLLPALPQAPFASSSTAMQLTPTRTHWTPNMMRDLYNAVHTVPKKGNKGSYDWVAISKVLGCDSTEAPMNKWRYSVNSKTSSPLEAAFLGEKVMTVLHDGENMQQEVVGEVVAYEMDTELLEGGQVKVGIWDVKFADQEDVKKWKSAELLQGWRLYKENH